MDILAKGAPMRELNVSGVKSLPVQVKQNFTDLVERLAKSGMNLEKFCLNYFSEHAGHGEAILRSLASNPVNSENMIEFDIGRNEQWFSDFDLAEPNTLALCEILKQTVHLRTLNLSYNGLNGALLELILSALR